jgi:hypothetical protein
MALFHGENTYMSVGKMETHGSFLYSLVLVPSNMDYIKYYAVVLETFPSINGMMDLFYKDGHIYYERMDSVGDSSHWGLCCAYDLIDKDSTGMKVRKEGSECIITPISSRLCGHVIEEEVYHLHHLFRATRIALCVL